MGRATIRGNEIVKVFYHHVYEYRKGLRSLVLHTIDAKYQPFIEERLSQAGISYEIYKLRKNMNVFFGADTCVEVIRRIGKSNLSDYTPEEDFILGTMLGYDRLGQCERYLQRSEPGAKPCCIPSVATMSPEALAIPVQLSACETLSQAVATRVSSG